MFEEGNEDQAIQLLLIAKEFQSQRLIYSDFFGDLIIIKHIVLDLYSLIQFDSDYMDLFDLYYVLQKPCKLALEINGKDYISKPNMRMIYSIFRWMIKTMKMSINSFKMP